jgi:hypothetical protein
MKTLPKTPEFQNFTDAMRKILTISKTELLRREVKAKEERKAKRSSASSGRASRAKD